MEPIGAMVAMAQGRDMWRATRGRLVAAVVAVVVLVGACSVQAFPSGHENCATWAQEGECGQNPNYMMNACRGECYETMSNPGGDREECRMRAERGDCARGGLAVLFDCAVECGMQAFWNSYKIREAGDEYGLQAIGFDAARDPGADDVTFFAETLGRATGDPAGVSQGVVGLVALARLRMFFHGYNPMHLGQQAPSEELFVAGLTHSVLGAVRALHSACPGDDAEGAEPRQREGDLEVWSSWCSVMEAAEARIMLALENRETDMLSRSMPLFVDELADYVRRLGPRIVAMHSHPAMLASVIGGPSSIAEHRRGYEHEVVYPLAALNTPGGTADFVERATGPTIQLVNGVEMPLVGFGTWQLTGQTCVDAVATALRAGYRSIDTAQAYGNEAQVGEGIELSGISREEIFLATKLSFPDQMGYEKTMAAVQRQLSALRTDYIDLYMLHGFFGTHEQRLGTMQALARLVKRGVIRAVGVSNFGVQQLHDLSHYSPEVDIAVVQNKYDPYHQGTQLTHGAPEDIIGFAKQSGVIVVGYSTFSAWPFAVSALGEPVVQAIAKRHGVTPSQVLLRWSLQNGVSIIPRSHTPEHIRSNFNLFGFTLSNDEMTAISALQWLVESPNSRSPGSGPIY